MAIRSYSNIGVQIGAEGQAGNAVPANKKLMGLKIDPQASFETVQHKASGARFASVSSVISEKTEADWEGPIDYATIVYPLSSLFGPAVVTQPDAEASPAAYQWKWEVSNNSEIKPKTYSFEVGDTTRASKFAYGAFTSMELSIDRTGDNTMSGSIVGQELVTGATMTPNPTAVEIVPVNGNHWDVWADDSAATIGTTQMLSVYEAGLSFSDLLAEEFTINSSKQSFTSLFLAEEPTFEWTMMIGADAKAEEYFAKLRGGQKTFIRLKATGPEMDGGTPFSIEIDMAVIVTSFDAFESRDGIYVLPITFALAEDGEWGKAMTITVTNDVAAL